MSLQVGGVGSNRREKEVWAGRVKKSKSGCRPLRRPDQSKRERPLPLPETDADADADAETDPDPDTDADAQSDADALPDSLVDDADADDDTTDSGAGGADIARGLTLAEDPYVVPPSS